MTSGRRLVLPPLRADLLNLLGWKQQGTQAGEVIRYVRVGRWLVRPGLLRRFLGSSHCRAADLVRMRVHSFSRTSVAGDADLVLIRDEHRPKVCVFSLASRRKKVQLLSEFDHRQEMEAMAIMAGQGVRLPPILERDDATNSYVQEIVCDPLGRAAVISPRLAEELLLAFVRRNEVSFLPLDLYAERNEQALSAAAAYLPAGLHRALSEVLSEFTRQSTCTEVPIVQCHGDFSTGNIIRSDAGEYLFIDFDRSFVANLLFDVMYFGVTSGLPRWKVIDLLTQAARSANGRLGPSGDALYDVARSLFLLDLNVFAARRYAEIPSPVDRVCRFTLSIIEQTIRA